MKIAEIEAILINGDVSDGTIEQYKIALSRVPRAHRCQHCYTTAASFGVRHYNYAFDLIHYGLQYCDSWSDRMRAYYNMAIIYEQIKDYSSALGCYAEALNAIPEEQKTLSYTSEYAAHLMRMEMHIHHFEYTEKLRQFYLLAIQADHFSRAFVKKVFYEAIAEIILFQKDGMLDEMKQSLYKANALLSDNYSGPLTSMLKRKGYTEITGATKEALVFLNKMKKHISKR